MDKLTIELPEDNVLGSGSESLWVKRAPDGLGYIIYNVPFLAKGINWGDVVSAEERGGELIFSSVLKKSGRSTVRIYFLKRESTKHVESAMREISKDIGWETHSEKIPLYAIDIPPGEGLAVQVMDLIKSMQAQGILEYEIGDIQLE